MADQEAAVPSLDGPSEPLPKVKAKKADASKVAPARLRNGNCQSCGPTSTSKFVRGLCSKCYHQQYNENKKRQKPRAPSAASDSAAIDEAIPNDQPLLSQPALSESAMTNERRQPSLELGSGEHILAALPDPQTPSSTRTFTSSLEFTTNTPHGSDISPSSPATSIDFKPQLLTAATSTLATAGNSKSIEEELHPSLEDTSPVAHKRRFLNIEELYSGSGTFDEDESNHAHKHQKLDTDSSIDREAEDEAIKSSAATVASVSKAQEEELTSLDRLQQEQRDAMLQGHRVRLQVLKRNHDNFNKNFALLQQSRSYFENEMAGWKHKHVHLEAVLKQTQEERDEWKAAKEQADQEKADIEDAKRQSEGETDLVIAQLQEKITSLKKSKAALIQQLVAEQSD